MAEPQVLIFDVNETLLDLKGVRAAISSVLGGAEPLAEWFFRMLHGSVVANETDTFRPFETIGVEALRAVAARRGIELSDGGAADLVAGFRSLPPHPDVPGGLDRLEAAGYRLIALSNGSKQGIPMQLANAGISDRFEMIVSVEEAGRFKPDPAPYLLALQRANIQRGRALMVAAHDWDILGARNVGIAGAFITRPGVVWSLPGDPPALTPPDLETLASALGA